jgi:hypothetical protein
LSQSAAVLRQKNNNERFITPRSLLDSRRCHPREGRILWDPRVGLRSGSLLSSRSSAGGFDGDRRWLCRVAGAGPFRDISCCVASLLLETLILPHLGRATASGPLLPPGLDGGAKRNTVNNRDRARASQPERGPRESRFAGVRFLVLR